MAVADCLGCRARTNLARTGPQRTHWVDLSGLLISNTWQTHAAEPFGALGTYCLKMGPLVSLHPCPTLSSQFSLFSQLGPRPLPKSNAQEAETQLLAVYKTPGCCNSLYTIPRAPKSYKSPAFFLGEPLVNASNSESVSVSLF